MMIPKRFYQLMFLLLLLGLLLSFPSASVAAQTSPINVFAEVLARDELICGVQAALPGFSYQDAEGEFSGLDVEICRAIAAAVLGNAEKVSFVPLSTSERFEALRARRVDLLIRNTTWSLSRDADEGIDFGPVIFYDGQGVMVRRDSGIFNVNDLANQPICVQPDTTTALNLVTTMAAFGLEYETVTVGDLSFGMESLENGACTVLTADRSALIARQAFSNAPENLILLDVTLSQEPLAPAYLEGDAGWGDVIRWVIFGLIHAERLGINSENIESFFGSDIPEVALLLGESGNLGTKLGLRDSFVAQAVRQVGNYGEIYARNLGAGSQVQLPRGQNALWVSGGLLYAPPFR